jgi:hypothetical protein
MERFEDFYNDINMDDWAEYEDVEGEHKEFEIKDASTADWAISKIADERKRKDYFVECANKKIEKLKAQIKEMEEKCERNTSYLSGCLGKYLERDEVPKKKTTTQESITLPAGKIIKKFPKIEYVMSSGEAVTKHKNDDDFIKEIKRLDKKLIRNIKEVDWSTLKNNITNTEDGMVIYKETGDIIESLSTRETLPSIEVKTE